MKQYEEFLENLKSYFEYDEVVSQGNIISAYDLLCILKERISILHDIIYEKKDLIKEIEDYYKGKNIFEFLYKKIAQKQIPQVDFLNQRYENNRASIYIHFYSHTCYDYTSLEICKEPGTNELYFGSLYSVDKDFVEYFRETILQNLQILEDFVELFRLSLPNIKSVPGDEPSIEEIVADEFLKLRIAYDSYGNVTSKISILPTIDPENIYERIWLDHPSLKEFVSKHETELLKKIPINILDLKASTQKIVTDYYSRNNVDTHKLELK